MTINWKEPVETDETPPRPVRVLATDIDNSGFPVVVALNYAHHHDAEPLCKAVCYSPGGVAWKEEGPRLRNVAPKPVRYEAWINLYADGATGAACASREEVEAMANPSRAECRHIVWNSDGSPVEDDEGLADQLVSADALINTLKDDRDHWKVKAETLLVDIQLQQRDRKGLSEDRDHWKAKAEALEAAPDPHDDTDPRNMRCETCRYWHPGTVSHPCTEPSQACGWLKRGNSTLKWEEK